MQNLKLGFIGGGINSAVGTTHFIASQMDGLFEVVSGCFSQNDTINLATGLKRNVAKDRIYPSSGAFFLAEKGLIDAVVVLTPTPSHYDLILEAFRFGIPVISEKSLASTSREAIEICQNQNNSNMFLAVTYNYTGYPMLRELRRWILENKLGKPKQVMVEMPQDGYARVGSDGEPLTPQRWRLRDEQIPVLSLDLGVHLHNIIDFVTNEQAIELVATQNTFGVHHKVIDSISCIARYTNGLEANIWYGKTALGYRNGLRIRVFCEEGAIAWHQMDPEYLEITNAKGRRFIIDRADDEVTVACDLRYNRFKSGHPSGFIEAFANTYADIHKSLVGYVSTGDYLKNEYIFNATDSAAGLRMLETIQQSASSRAWQKVPR